MELEVGMYVRTKKGLIAKYLGYEKDEELENSKYIFDGKIYWYYEYYNDYVYEEDFKGWFEEKVIKTSHNIIDLIEEGDYVNGAKVDNIILKDDKEICFRYKYAFEKEDVYTLHLEDIKTIVTKEMFESMQYEVK